MSTGIIADISKYQGKPDFSKLKSVVAALIIRVQYGSLSEDPNHVYDEAHAINYGIPFGEYAYGHFVSVNDAKVEARDFLKRISKNAKFLVLDVEDDTVKSCGTKNLKAATQAFIDVCRAAGYRTGFYVSHYLYKSYGLDQVKAGFLWLPRYGANNGKPDTKPDWPCDLWQYTSAGRLPGINGVVDLSQLNGKKDLNWFLGIKPTPVISSSPKEVVTVSEQKASGPFKDVTEDRWSAQAIERLKEKGVFHGRPDGTFGPTDATTREELAAAIDNLLNYLGK